METEQDRYDRIRADWAHTQDPEIAEKLAAWKLVERYGQ